MYRFLNRVLFYTYRSPELMTTNFCGSYIYRNQESIPVRRSTVRLFSVWIRVTAVMVHLTETTTDARFIWHIWRCASTVNRIVLHCSSYMVQHPCSKTQTKSRKQNKAKQTRQPAPTPSTPTPPIIRPTNLLLRGKQNVFLWNKSDQRAIPQS